MSSSPYSILNISENASFNEIKSAYRKLSMIHHPDRNLNNTSSRTHFQEINNAYQFLISNFNAPSKSSSNINSFTNHSISKPPPIIINLEVDFYKIFSGSSLPIHISRSVTIQDTTHHENETIYITIPPGTDDNEIFILENKGDILENNIFGDVKVFIKIINNSLFKRQGLDLIFNKSISLKDALCGFHFFLEFLDGKSYKINNHSGNIISPGHKKIINNMGLVRDNIRGNLIIEFTIDFPKKLSCDTIEILNAHL